MLELRNNIYGNLNVQSIGVFTKLEKIVEFIKNPTISWDRRMWLHTMPFETDDPFSKEPELHVSKHVLVSKSFDIAGNEIKHSTEIRGSMNPAEKFIEDRLTPPLLHGNDEHQQWIREELRKWIPDLEKLLSNTVDGITEELSAGVCCSSPQI